jgi:hypothetical protein
MSSEHKYFARFVYAIVLCVVAVGVAFILILLLSINPESYASSLSYKFSRLESSPTPRIILVGGSGVAIEIDSEKLYKDTGLHPTNMGVYAGLGLRFMLRSIDDKLKDGDVVLLIPEHELLQQPPYGSGYLLMEALHANPTYIPYALTYHSLTTMARHSPGWLQLRIKDIYVHKIEPLFFEREQILADRLYSIHNINAYGDVDSTIAGDEHITTEDVLDSVNGYVGPMNPVTLALLAQTMRAWNERGVRVLVAWAPLSRTIYELDPNISRARYETLVKYIGKENIVGTPEDFIFEDDKFLDGPTHITNSGKQDFTRILTPLLAERL